MTIEEANTFLDNLKVCIEEHPIVADWLIEIADRKIENCSEKPNNCEHITEDSVTCAKCPARDDCPDNPLNKVKGSKRLLKGYHEKEDEPQKDCNGCKFVGTYDTEFPCANCNRKTKDYYAKDEQTDCPWK